MRDREPTSKPNQTHDDVSKSAQAAAARPGSNAGRRAAAPGGSSAGAAGMPGSASATPRAAAKDRPKAGKARPKKTTAEPSVQHPPAVQSQSRPRAAHKSKASKPDGTMTVTTDGQAILPQSTQPIAPEQRHAMIAEIAYLRAERRGFAGGDSVTDWLEGEKEIDRTLAQRRL